ncbi:MAG: HRDC domain-containing protein [Opitutales bacterium]|nr:HRDC domain-containing protein [Opitutales bacterium]
MGKISFKYNFFQIPACGDTFLEEELNSFLESKAVVDIRQEFAHCEGGSHWCFSVRWRDGALTKDTPKRAKALVDYKEILSPADFVTFARLREVRKELAKAEQVPAYAIFTNEQLAEIAKILPVSANALSKIEGVGENRVGKYGGQFLKVLKDEAKIRTSDAKP